VPPPASALEHADLGHQICLLRNVRDELDARQLIRRCRRLRAKNLNRKRRHGPVSTQFLGKFAAKLHKAARLCQNTRSRLYSLHCARSVFVNESAGQNSLGFPVESVDAFFTCANIFQKRRHARSISDLCNLLHSDAEMRSVP